MDGIYPRSAVSAKHHSLSTYFEKQLYSKRSPSSSLDGHWKIRPLSTELLNIHTTERASLLNGDFVFIFWGKDLSSVMDFI